MSTEPLVLLANSDQWLTESLESVLTQGGYRVLATAKRQQVLDLARRYLPDGILLDMGLDQRANDNLTLCRALRVGGLPPPVGGAARLGGCSTPRRACPRPQRRIAWRGRSSPPAGSRMRCAAPAPPSLRYLLPRQTKRARKDSCNASPTRSRG